MRRDQEERLVALAVAGACLLAIVAILGPISYPATIAGAADAPMAAGDTPHTTVHRPLGQVDLRITLWPRGPASASRTWRVTCPGTGCAAARAHARDLITEPAGDCSQVDGGPGEALIIGRVGRHLVDDWFDQRDGCSTQRWRRLRAVLRPPVRAVAMTDVDASRQGRQHEMIVRG